MYTLSPRSSTIFGGVLLTVLILAYMATSLNALIIWMFGIHRPVEAYCTGRAFYFLFVFILWYYAFQFEKQPMLLWKEKNYSIGATISHVLALYGVILMAVFIFNLILFFIIHKKPESELVQRLAVFFKAHKLLLVYTSLTAGITEELIFRGYLLPRLELLLKRPWLAIAISSLIFGLGHYRYGTIQNVLDPVVIGAILAVYYRKYRNIKVAIIFHCLWDLVGLFYLIAHK